MKKLISIVLLSTLLLIGIFLRIPNITPFTVYPDSYQNLLVAENIATYQSVVGFLGPNGMLYPDFFMWTRPVYALFILIVSNFGIQSEIAARSIAFVLGIFAIPLAYFVLQALYKDTKDSTAIALSGAALLTFSFNHAVWGGMIMTETTGVFFMLLFLYSFFLSVKQPTKFFRYFDLATGLFFAVAVMTRYEYALLIIPVIIFIFAKSPQPYTYLRNFFMSFLGTILFMFFTLFPIQSIFPIIFTQHQELLLVAGILIVLSFTVLILIRRQPKRLKSVFKKFPLYSSGFIALICLYITLQIFFPIQLPWFSEDLSFLRRFFNHDLLLSVFSVIGIILLLNSPKYRFYGYFAITAIVVLVLVYHRINPDMERYVTHLLPFLLIPASYGLLQTMLYMKRARMPLLYALPVILFLVQGFVSANGLRNLNDPSWYRLSYEEQVARKIQSVVPDDAVLLVSTPEPYYYFFQQTTHSLTDSPPYIYMPDSLENRKVVIVEDMGMHEYFPTFTYLLRTKLQQYKKAEFYVPEQYHTGNQSVTFDGPVTLYEMTVQELKRAIQTGLVRNYK